jgi:hypothetical protein
MSGYARVSTLVVAIAVALLSACSTGVVASSPTARSSAAPTAAPSAPPTATLVMTQGPTPVPTLPPSGQLAPGSYRSDFITYTLPAGWSSYQSWGANKNDGNPPNGMFIAPWASIVTVYKDPCHWQTTAAAVGPKVDDEVAALVAQKRGSTATPADVTIDGFRGKQVDLMVPLDVNIAACDQATYKSFTDANGGDRYNQGPGQHDLLDILDVNGQTLVIDRVFYPANTAADRAELQAIFDSIKITP